MDALLERQAELAELTGLARRAARGAGQVVLLRGEAGVGKTALIARFTAALGPSWQVLRGWCDPLATPRPLGPLLDTLAGLSGEPAATIRTALNAGHSEAVYAGLPRLLAGATRWVWVIEDAHWADGATLDLLRFVTRRVGSLPLLLIVSHRDDELGQSHPLTVALGDIASCAGLSRIQLAPLSLSAVTQLSTGSGVNAERLYHLSGGNPFYVTEVLAAGPDALGDGELPASVSEAVWGRLARLSAPGRAAADAAAILGPAATAELIEQLAPGCIDTGLPECLHAGVLRAEGTRVRFRHELARRAALEQIPDHRRRVMHARALAALSEPPIEPETLGALAFHADQAGDSDAALRHGPAAAERAAALGANREAADLFVLVLRHADTVPADQKVKWLEQHAFASYFCGLGEAAVSSLRKAIPLRHQLGDRLAEAEDLRLLSHALVTLGRLGQAAEAGLASLRLLQDGIPCPQLASSLVNMAEIGVFGFDPAVADYAARAMKVGAELGDHSVVLRARGFAAFARVLRTDTGWDELEAAWRDAMATDARGEYAGKLGADICISAALHYEPDRADQYTEEFAAYWQDRNLWTFEALVIGIAALVGLHRGEWAHACVCAEDVLTRPGLSTFHQILPRLTLALVHARRGEQPVASLLDEIEASSEVDQLRFFPVWAARAEAAWLAGDNETARHEAQTGLTTIGADGDPWVVWQLHRWAQLSGGPATPVAIDGPLTPFELEVSGDWRAAADEWTRRGCPYDAAIAQLGGDIAAVQSGLATFRRLGARAAARRAQARLAALRGRTPRTRRADTMSDPDGLTRREREVLELLAGGHSDAQIAATLHISPKTTYCHINSILDKLGVDNRVQAAAHARHRHPTHNA